MEIARNLLIRIKSQYFLSTLLVCVKHWEDIHADVCNYSVVIEDDQVCIGIRRIVWASFYAYYAWTWFKTCTEYVTLNFYWEDIEQRKRLGKRWVDLRLRVNSWV